MVDRDPATSPKRGGAPFLGPRLLWSNDCMDQDATWYGGRPRPTRHCVRRGPSSPSPKAAQPPQFSANVRCGQTAGWIKMALGTEVNLGPGDDVLDGAAAPLEGAQFSLHVCCSQTAGWTKTPLGTEVHWPRPHCIRRVPVPRERDTAALLFSAHVYCGHGRPSQLLVSSLQLCC